MKGKELAEEHPSITKPYRFRNCLLGRSSMGGWMDEGLIAFWVVFQLPAFVIKQAPKRRKDTLGYGHDFTKPV